VAGEDGFGTQFQRGDGATPTEAFTVIASVTHISGPQVKREAHDVTAHDSPNKAKEYKGGLRNGGEVSLDINFRPAVHKTLLDDLADENPRNYKVVFPDGSEWDFAGVMTGFETGAPHDNKLTAKATYQVSGMPTLT
jgi:predicted secreted protein